jgi:alpha-beta hydrolase superfamily lysophospholipase
VEEPFFFPHNGARLFGVFQRPDTPETSVGVVLCHPYAQERQLTDRILVRFSRLLGAAGFATLRFDYRGHGESDGTLADSTLEDQIAETLAAAELLKARLAVASIFLLGLRSGGTVAALAAERGPGTSGLILWSPVLSGPGYARELLRSKIAAQLALQEGTITREALVEAIVTDGRIEFDGDYLTRRMYEELIAIDLPNQVGRFGQPVLVTTNPGRGERSSPYEALASAYRRTGASAQLLAVREPDFCDVRSMFEGVFPQQLYQVTLDWIRSQ